MTAQLQSQPSRGWTSNDAYIRSIILSADTQFCLTLELSRNETHFGLTTQVSTIIILSRIVALLALEQSLSFLAKFHYNR